MTSEEQCKKQSKTMSCRNHESMDFVSLIVFFFFFNPEGQLDRSDFNSDVCIVHLDKLQHMAVSLGFKISLDGLWRISFLRDKDAGATGTRSDWEETEATKRMCPQIKLISFSRQVRSSELTWSGGEVGHLKVPTSDWTLCFKPMQAWLKHKECFFFFFFQSFYYALYF